MAEHFDFHFKAEESNINYYSKRLIKINKDINELMKINLEQKKFELYLENSNKEFKQIAEELKQFNNKHKVESEDFKLSYKDLYDKLNEFDFILNGIKDTLE